QLDAARRRKPIRGSTAKRSAAAASRVAVAPPRAKRRCVRGAIRQEIPKTGRTYSGADDLDVLARDRHLVGVGSRLAGLVLVAFVGWVIAAACAPRVLGAEHFHGKRYVANPTRQRAMDTSRAKS